MRRPRALLSIIILFFAWELVARFSPLPPALLPSFTDVVRVFLSWSTARFLLSNYLVTAERAVIGFLLGLVGGVGLGIVFSYRSIQDYVQPVATLFFAVPSVAWIPLLIVWVGLKEFRLPVIAAFLCAFPPVFYGMINALRTFDRDQVDVAMVLGARPHKILARIIIPQVVLRIIPLIKTEAVMVWKTVFVTEMVALSSGLGYLAMIYATTIEMDRLLGVVLLLSLTTLCIILFFDYVERRLSIMWLGARE